MPLEIDRSSRPLVVVRYPARCSSSDIDDLLVTLAALVEDGKPYAMLTDVSGMREPLLPALRARIDSFVEENRTRIGELSLGNVIVAGPSPLMRNVLTAYYRSRKPASETQVVSTFEEGIDWLLPRVGASSPELVDKINALQSITPVERPAERPTEEIHLDSLTHILDLFGEPAFVVDSAGVVVASNVAGKNRFVRPPPWLSRAVSAEPGPVGPLCRVVLVPGIDTTLHVVVPDASLIPPVPLSRSAEVLPASLRPVADLLATGMSDKEIASELDMSLSTLRTYVARSFKKLEVHSRAELIALWAARGDLE